MVVITSREFHENPFSVFLKQKKYTVFRKKTLTYIFLHNSQKN